MKSIGLPVLDMPLTPPSAWRDVMARARKTLRLWQGRVRQRRALARLDDSLLRDIGIGRGAARREARKPFWKR